MTTAEPAILSALLQRKEYDVFQCVKRSISFVPASAIASPFRFLLTRIDGVRNSDLRQSRATSASTAAESNACVSTVESGSLSSDAGDDLVAKIDLHAWGTRLTAAPIRTSHSRDGGVWNEWVFFPFDLCDLPLDCHVSIAVHGADGLVGSVCFYPFTSRGELKTGSRRYGLCLGKDPDSNEECTTLGHEASADWDKLARDHGLGRMAPAPWLDGHARGRVASLRREREAATDHPVVSLTLPSTSNLLPVFHMSVPPDYDAAASEYAVPPSPFVPFHDMGLGVENLSEAKAAVLFKSLHLVGDSNAQPSLKQSHEISAILNRPPIRAEPLKPEDAALLWQFRHFLCRHPKGFVPFMSCVDWDTAEREEAERLIPAWKALPTELALQLLSRDFRAVTPLRIHAIGVLSGSSDREINLYLLQLVQGTRYDAHGELAIFLTQRAAQCWELCSNLYWYVAVEADIEMKSLGAVNGSAAATDSAAATVASNATPNGANGTPSPPLATSSSAGTGANAAAPSRHLSRSPSAAGAAAMTAGAGASNTTQRRAASTPSTFAGFKQLLLTTLAAQRPEFSFRLGQQERLRRVLVSVYGTLTKDPQRDRPRRLELLRNIVQGRRCGIAELFAPPPDVVLVGSGSAQRDETPNSQTPSGTPVPEANGTRSSVVVTSSAAAPNGDAAASTSVAAGASPVYLPCHANTPVVGISPTTLYLFKSAKQPMKLPFILAPGAVDPLEETGSGGFGGVGSGPATTAGNRVRSKTSFAPDSNANAASNDATSSLFSATAGPGALSLAGLISSPTLSAAPAPPSEWPAVTAGPSCVPIPEGISPTTAVPPATATRPASPRLPSASPMTPPVTAAAPFPNAKSTNSTSPTAPAPTPQQPPPPVPPGVVDVIFKCGDDVRQDQLVLQLIFLMDALLKQDGMDLCLTVYRVLATSQSDGFMEVVRGVETFQSVKKETGIVVWLQRHNPQQQLFERAMDRFLKSCAGYCVMTYLLGIGDRHLENILITKDGRLVHIDFGFILGKDPKPFPPPMKLNREMVDAMGGTGSPRYARFKQMCCSAFNILRRHASLILNLLVLMIDASIPDLGGGGVEAARVQIMKVQDKLRLDLNDAEATQHIQGVIADSVGAVFTNLWDIVHEAAQAARA